MMTAFFMLSGFSIYYANVDVKQYRDISSVINYYKKRVISVMPLYWFITIAYPIYDILGKGGSLKTNILLMPIEFLGLQSVFHSTFQLTHNGGTWFVSCILICYLVFPYCFELTKKVKLNMRLGIGIILGVIRIYASLLVIYLGLESIYTNPFFRILEFVIGMLICANWLEIKNNTRYRKYCARWLQVILSLFIMIALITFMVNHSVVSGEYISRYMVYSGICLPIFSWLIICAAGLEAEWLEKMKLFHYVVELGYAFFLADFAVKPLTDICIPYTGSSNIILVVLTVLLCSGVAVVLHEGIEKPFKNILWRMLK